MEAKAQNGGLGSEKILNPASATFLSEGEKFWVKNCSPLFLLNYFVQGVLPQGFLSYVFFRRNLLKKIGLVIHCSDPRFVPYKMRSLLDDPSLFARSMGMPQALN